MGISADETKGHRYDRKEGKGRQDSFDMLLDERMAHKLNDMVSDVSHALKQEFDDRRIQRSGRLRVPKARTARYANSFVPGAVTLCNR